MGHKPSAAGDRSRNVIQWMPKMIGGEARGEVGNKGIQGICTKELDSMLLLKRTDKKWIRNNLETRGFESVVQFTEALLPAIGDQMMKFGRGVCLLRNFEDVVMKGTRVLNGGLIGVIPVVEFDE
jgi:hypothetical protein